MFVVCVTYIHDCSISTLPLWPILGAGLDIMLGMA